MSIVGYAIEARRVDLFESRTRKYVVGEEQRMFGKRSVWQTTVNWIREPVFFTENVVEEINDNCLYFVSIRRISIILESEKYWNIEIKKLEFECFCILPFIETSSRKDVEIKFELKNSKMDGGLTGGLKFDRKILYLLVRLKLKEIDEKSIYSNCIYRNRRWHKIKAILKLVSA